MKHEWYFAEHNTPKEIEGGMNGWNAPISKRINIDGVGVFVTDAFGELDDENKINTKFIPLEIQSSNTPILIADPCRHLYEDGVSRFASYQILNDEAVWTLMENASAFPALIVTAMLNYMNSAYIPLGVAVATILTLNAMKLSALNPDSNIPDSSKIMQYLPSSGFGIGSQVMMRTAVATQMAIEYAERNSIGHIGHVWGSGHVYMHNAIEKSEEFRRYVIRRGAENHMKMMLRKDKTKNKDIALSEMESLPSRVAQYRSYIPATAITSEVMVSPFVQQAFEEARERF